MYMHLFPHICTTYHRETCYLHCSYFDVIILDVVVVLMNVCVFLLSCDHSWIRTMDLDLLILHHGQRSQAKTIVILMTMYSELLKNSVRPCNTLWRERETEDR
jgi:hypothetical protein